MILLYLIPALLFGVLVEAQQLCQDQSYCLNGGTCTLTSGVAAARRCKPSEVFHENSCYSFLAETKNWEDAARYCHDRDASLPVTSSDDDQKFLSTYTQGAMDGAAPSDRTISGVWTGIRSVSNGSSPAWVSYPGSHLVTTTFWQSGEPNIYPNWNDVCVSLSRDTLYRNWFTQRCDSVNYVVCRRDLPPEDKELLQQCTCSSQYQGIRCELSATAGSSTSSQQASCPSSPFTFSCQNGETIVVDYASFGAVEGVQCCPTCLSNHTCANANSLQTLINKCQGMTFCEVLDLYSLFPETPCPVKEELQLQYRMRCSQEVQANCPSGAFYVSGRCYSISFESNKGKRLNKADAAEKCRTQGGQLVTGIVSSTVNEELSRQIRRKTKEGEFWIDIQSQAGQDKWADGTAITYSPPDSLLTPAVGCVVLSVDDTASIWKSTACEERSNYVCEFAPSVGSPRPKEQAVTVEPPMGPVFKGDGGSTGIDDIFGDAKYCPEQTFKGVFYPKTRACMEAKEACPDPENIIGTVTRYCNCKSFKWDPPNTTNCTHKWVSEVRALLDRGDPAEDVSQSLADNLGRTVSRQLYGGDIVGSVSLSDDVLTLAKNQYSLLLDRNDRERRTTNFTQSLGTSGDELLSTKAVPVWSELENYKRIDHASTLMSVLEQSALLLADYSIDPSRKLSYTNWAMEIEVREPESYESSFNGATMISNSARVPMDDTAGAFAQPAAASFGSDAQSSVQFSSVSKSPVITLPSLGTLKESSDSNQPPAAMGASAFFHPGGSGQSSLDRSRLRLGYYVFTTFGSLLSDDEHSVINSHVIGASVDDATRSLSLPSDQPVTFTFYHLQKTGVSNPRCVFWNLELKQWSSEGCELLSTNSDSSQCACTHLTSFAILMDVSGRVSRYSGSLSAALDVVSTIGCAISIVCLALSLAVFTFFRSLYNIRNTIHRNLCFCLLVAELTFVIGMDRTSNPTGCSVVAVFLHYFFLASFCWMLLEGYQLYLMLIQVFEPSKTHIVLYYIFCYGFPAAVVGVSAGVAWDNYGTDAYCWIDTSTPTIWAFVIPIILVIIANVIFLAIALRVVLSVKSRDRTKSDRLIGWLKGSAMLLCLLGVTWVFGFLTAVKGGTGTAFAWIFTILNCTQGIFIFVLHVVMNDKVRSAVVKWIRTGVCCLPETSSAYNSRSYISSRQRIMNMVKSQSPSDPSTASTDDKERQMTPTSKTNEWLRRISMMQDSVTSNSSANDVTPSNEVVITHDRRSTTSDPRGSQVLDVESEPMEKQAPVKRKKFPLGASEYERGSMHRNSVVVERF